jgi:hypothetical protein
MWKTTGGGCAWPDQAPLIGESDKILCWESKVVDRRLGNQNLVATCPQWHDQLTDKDAAVEGDLLTARRAGCGDASARRSGTTVPAGGWMMTVCPDSYANNVVTTGTAVCAPRHQAFMNHTRRNTGSRPMR